MRPIPWCRYLNASGLIWENAPAFGALVVFAEHRYYGASKPFKKTLKEHMQFLTSEQAMADYAELITELKHDLGAKTSAVIGFGGSYGEPSSGHCQRCIQQLYSGQVCCW